MTTSLSKDLLHPTWEILCIYECASLRNDQGHTDWLPDLLADTGPPYMRSASLQAPEQAAGYHVQTHDQEAAMHFDYAAKQMKTIGARACEMQPAAGNRLAGTFLRLSSNM